MAEYYYVIEHNDEELFFAELRKGSRYGNTVFEIEGPYMVEEGHMKHQFDTSGLKKLMTEYGVMKSDDELHLIN